MRKCMVVCLEWEFTKELRVQQYKVAKRETDQVTNSLKMRDLLIN